MKRQMPDGSYRTVGDSRARLKGLTKKQATHLGGSRAGRRMGRRKVAE